MRMSVRFGFKVPFLKDKMSTLEWVAVTLNESGNQLPSDSWESQLPATQLELETLPNQTSPAEAA